jgi:ferredoxin-NADP reductase
MANRAVYFIDRLLNTTTMYRLVLYVLIALVLVAALLGGIGLIPFNGFYILASAAFLVAISVLANWLFARTFGAAPNVESVYITALILALVINPDSPAANLGTLAWAAILATASKYLLAFHRRHVFNPVAIAVVITSYALGRSASWWVDAPALLPFVVSGGFLIVRKIRSFDMVWSFFFVYFAAVLVFDIMLGVDVVTAVRQSVLDSPLVFLAFVMLTEPLTAPPTRPLQMAYGGLVAFLIVPQVHVGSLYFAPELALVIANVFAWLVSAKTNQMVRLIERHPISRDGEEFVFRQERSLRFRPGQYLEWTLPHDHPDDRGDRRFFTITSPPGVDTIAIAVEFSPRPSTFKNRLRTLEPGDTVFAAHLAGDFVLPRDPGQKLAFVAGGIGVTPFVSMVRDLLMREERRDLVLLISNKYETGVTYGDLFEQARKDLGIRTVFTLTGAAETVPTAWPGRIGRIDEALIREEIPDHAERIFYLCGSQRLVRGITGLLGHLGITGTRIRTDYFPGLP